MAYPPQPALPPFFSPPPPPLPSTLPPSLDPRPLPPSSLTSSVSTQAQILQLQTQILQLQAQLSQPASSSSPSTSLELPSQSRFRSHSATPSSQSHIVSPRSKFAPNAALQNSLSLPHPIAPLPLSVPRCQTLPRQQLPPQHLPPPRPPPRAPSIVSRRNPSSDNLARSRTESVGDSLLVDAGLVLEASRKSYEQRLKDLDQYRAQLRAEAALMPRHHSSDSSLSLSFPTPEADPAQPSMSDIAAKVLSVLTKSESNRSVVKAGNQTERRFTDSGDDVQSLASDPTDDERSVSSGRSPSRSPRVVDLQPELVTLKGGNLLEKSGLRGWSKRYVLLNATGLLTYEGSVMKSSVPVTGDSEVRMGPGAEFMVSDGGRKETVVLFAAGSEIERREWMTAIQGVIEVDKKSLRYETRNGEIKLRFWFEEDKFTLHVDVVEARGLKRKSKKLGTYNNPYVKLKILPPQGKAQRTRVITKCVDPHWDETFDFRLQRSTLTVQTLHLKIKNDETGLDAVFGEVEVPLLNVSFDEQEPTDAWFPLQIHSEKKEEIPSIVVAEGRSRSRSRDIRRFAGDLSSISSADYGMSLSPSPNSSVRRLSRDNSALLLDEQIVPVGTIRASVWYDTDSEMLKVEIMECRLHKAGHHFIEIRIMPLESEALPRKTKIHKDGVFHERFELPLSQTKVTFATLSFLVKDRRSTFGKAKDIGEFVLPLERIPRTSTGAMQTHWLTAPSSTIFEIYNLGDILLLEAGYQSFLHTVQKEHSTENLLFWKDVQDFRYKYLDAPEDHRPACMAECLAMCSQYIDVGSENEINVQHATKERIRAQLREEKQLASNTCENLAGIFDRSQSEVLDLMSRDPFARYLASQEWAIFSKSLQLDSTEKELGFKVVIMIVDPRVRVREAQEQRDGRRRLPDALQRDIISSPRRLRPRTIITLGFG